MRKSLGILLVFLIGSLIWAGSKGEVITVASDCTRPPMEMVDENQEITGFDIDLIKAVADEAGINIDIVNIAREDLFTSLSDGTCDLVISSLSITEKAMETVEYTLPYINAGQVLVVPADSNATTLADLAGMDLGAQIGTPGAFVIEESSSILKNYDKLGFAMEDLANGNLAGLVCAGPWAAEYVLGNEIYKNSLKIVGEPISDTYFVMAVSKGNSSLLKKLNKAIEELIANGTRDALEDKWLR